MLSFVDQIVCVTYCSNDRETTAVQAELESASQVDTAKTQKRNLCALMGKCHVTLISDAELCPSRSFLPSNFWDAAGFKGVDLSKDLIDSIECW